MNKKRVSLLALILAIVLGLFGLLPHEESQIPESTGSAVIETTLAAEATTEHLPDQSTSAPTEEAEPPAETSSAPTEAPTQQPTERPQEKPQSPKPQEPPKPTEVPTEAPVVSYTSKEEVARYIHLHGRLPDNFITKSQARALGWSGGSVEPYAPGCCIGGDTFGNREGLLPDAPGRTWKECDIDTLGKSSRGAKRIVFSNDGLIYYTDDHYQTFELLYGEL